LTFRGLPRPQRFACLDCLEKRNIGVRDTEGGDVGLTGSDLLQGTLDLIVLRTLAVQPMHGWQMAHHIQQVSDDVFRVNQGSLYPALQRLVRKGWIRAEWRRTENNRRARYYDLTPAGRRRLGEETENWRLVSGAMDRILSTG
jgi:transcriptional regulator